MMIRGGSSSWKEVGDWQESKNDDEKEKKKGKGKSSSSSGSGSGIGSSKCCWWNRLKDPRIVRVSRAFGGKDRHSKVCTVRGLRDRRVRLSVPTAIQLYDLQHRLGLTQPSMVVDWLLNAAKDEIDHLPPLHFNHEQAGAGAGAGAIDQLALPNTQCQWEYYNSLPLSHMMQPSTSPASHPNYFPLLQNHNNNIDPTLHMLHHHHLMPTQIKIDQQRHFPLSK